MQGSARQARPRARDLVEATPDSRNRYVDLIRVVSIGVVVVGHWMLAVLGFTDGEFTGHNLLELEPDLQLLTWLFQVMPLFFIVGGFTNATSWASAQARGTSYGGWLAAKSARLIRPAFWFVAFWTVVPALAVAIGLLSPGVARVGGQEVALPLWFLAVYLLAVAAVPPLLALHRRFGVWTLVGLVAAVVVVDNLRFGLDVTNIGIANYAFMWLAVLELGSLWRDGALRRRAWMPWAMAGGGLVTLVVLTAWFDFPTSMIDLTHAPRSNAQPPSLALFALAVWQCGAMLLFEDVGNRVLARPRPWLAVVVANSMVMTFFLWNMSAVVLAAVILFPTGIAPQPEPLGTAWWLLRPAWLLACAICITPFLLGFRWAERPAAPPGPWPGGIGPTLVGLGTVAAAAGFAILAANAFPVPGESVFWPSTGAVLIGAGAVLVRVDPIAPLRHG
jgi:fucose 4-O-acetylase-like acetyltransferase